MAKKYCKYTKKQLLEYCNDESYCVKCVDGTMHIGLPPWGLKKFSETVRNIVSAEKLNRFDSKLNGIVLDIQSIKVIGEEYPVRNDSSTLHVSLNVKFYVFQPRIGAVVLGVVKHVALHHISVTIHRFFNVVIPMETKNSALKTNMTVMVKLTKFDLDDSIPYFEGKLQEILRKDQKENSMDSGVSTTDSATIQVKQEKVSPDRSNSESDSDSDSDDSNAPNTLMKPDANRKGHSDIKAKVKQEPVSSIEESSSSSEDSTSATKTKNLLVPKKEKATSSSSSSVDSASSTENSKGRNKGERKAENGSSLIGRSLSKKKDVRKNDSESSSDDESDVRKKIKNNSFTDNSFASPGLSSTRIKSKSSKSKSKSKDSETNEFLKRMMKRFNK